MINTKIDWVMARIHNADFPEIWCSEGFDYDEYHLFGCGMMSKPI
jgi:hypothetical protein